MIPTSIKIKIKVPITTKKVVAIITPVINMKSLALLSGSFMNCVTGSLLIISPFKSFINKIQKYNIIYLKRTY